MSSANLHSLPATILGWTQVPLAQSAWVQIPQLSFFARQAYPEDVAFALATCSGQHTRSRTLNMTTAKVEVVCFVLFCVFVVFMFVPSRRNKRQRKEVPFALKEMSQPRCRSQARSPLGRGIPAGTH